MFWMLYPEAKFFDQDQYSRYAPDLAKDPIYQWLNRYFLLLQIPLGLLLYGLGGWSFVIYGVFLRAVLLWHSTWFINSVTHMWGYRTFDLGQWYGYRLTLMLTPHPWLIGPLAHDRDFPKLMH